MSGPLGSSQWMYSSGGFYPTEIDQSLKFDGTSYLTRTPSVAGNRRTWTYSSWFKRWSLTPAAGGQSLFYAGNNTSSPRGGIVFGNAGDDKLSINGQLFNSTTGVLSLETTAQYRDPSAWYHLVVSLDTTQATASDRCKMYVNGVQVTAFGTATYPSLNQELQYNDAILHATRHPSGDYKFVGYLADTYFVDGQALDPTSFGEFKSGVWIPKAYTGSYGTNGFHLTYQDDTVSEGFNTVTYTGTGTTQSISGIGFSPDFVWTKLRSQAGSHSLADVIRGGTAVLRSDLIDAEVTRANHIQSFDADGFTLGADGTSNLNGRTNVAWCWDAGDSTVSNTDGSITSSVRANPAYGFSIVTVPNTGSVLTAGHGLNQAPEMIIEKSRGLNDYWVVYHKDLGNTKALALNQNWAVMTSTSFWNDTSPTSSVWTMGNQGAVNTSGQNTVAYCFHSVAGYSKFGSYTGNGSASGPTVTLGFKPAFVMIKRTDVVNSWVMYDNTRQTTNPKDLRVLADSSDFEFDGNEYITFTDTGFEIQYSGNLTNASGGTYIYMAFADTRDLAFWRDQSGNGNDWQPTNLNYQDTVFDSPTNNFATLNPLAPSGGTFSNGNLSWSSATTDGRFALSTISPSTDGKWYCEVNIGSKASTYWTVGLFAYPATALPRILYRSDGAIYLDGSNVATVSSFTQGDVIGMAYDGSTRSLTLYKNNTSLGSWTASSTTINYFFGCASDSSGSSANYTLNFGQSGFTYTPPDGFLALSTANLPEPSISPANGDSPQDYFNTVLYTGNGALTRAITGVGFQADFTWAKRRNISGDHGLFDAVRGATQRLVSNSTAAEDGSFGLSSFDADGYTTNATYDAYNSTGNTYAAWNWKASNATAVSNTAGSITSQVSANTTAGFSVVSWSSSSYSDTIGHGLGVAPDMIIAKERSISRSWLVYHKSLGNNYYLNLDTTDAQKTPNSGRLQVSGTDSFICGTDGTAQIAYCFHDVEGYSKFGSYTGNGSTDGPFVYTGFRPAYIMAKVAVNQLNAADWQIWDTARETYNPEILYLHANTSAAESNSAPTYFSADLVSNGFKLRSANTYGMNQSGATYIYMAFAENPFKYANAR